ncbi:hypothetical protein [Nitratifractor sp.]|uniref:hypothetical protein n=1 Tax=Nitratifractor sp. TaxID=2268144 RepID=UPI0025F8CF62|nr:hypothetical protein [Nitratifractor sp.]
MKKGLLLSVVASTMIFAGGDIAPVEPAAPASADFWGQIGFSYDFNDNGTYNLGDKENNAFSAAVVLGVEKQLGHGFGVGFEVAGWTDFGLGISGGPRVTETLSRDWLAHQMTDGWYNKNSSAEVSQAYLTYSFGNTAIKVGRQALPKAVSPWAWSDRTVGVIDYSYDAIVIANTDLPDTTLVGAWVLNVAENSDTIKLGANGNGIFMLAAINKSLANTTLSASAYYFPDFDFKLPFIGWLWGDANAKDVWSVWASAVTKFDDINAGLQVAYVDGDYSNTDATFGIAGKIGSSWGDLDATLVASYINDGDYSLKTAGAGALGVGDTSAFWGNGFGGTFTNGDISDAGSVTALRVDLGYKLPVGKLYGGIGYAWYSDDTSSTANQDGFGARIGYTFPVMDTGVHAKVEYRYADNYQKTHQRVRVEAFYKF